MAVYANGYGSVTSIKELEGDSEIVSLTVKCYTGEKKKDDQEYAPSHRVNFIASKNYVNLVDLKPGDVVFFNGSIIRPYLYDKDGLSYILKLGYGTQVRKIYGLSKSTESQESISNSIVDNFEVVPF
jgi:hypothetical protein